MIAPAKQRHVRIVQPFHFDVAAYEIKVYVRICKKVASRDVTKGGELRSLSPGNFDKYISTVAVVSLLDILSMYSPTSFSYDPE